MAPLQKFQQAFVTSISTSNGEKKQHKKKIGNKQLQFWLQKTKFLLQQTHANINPIVALNK